jgi:hypothetical protein
MISSIVFTGHMIDSPGRTPPRFPAQLEALVRRWIRDKIVSAMKTAGTNTVCYASGARGGDLLFHEECRALGLRTIVVLPFPARDFEKSSVAGVASGHWRQRFRKLWRNTRREDRIVLHLPQSNEAYALCNTQLINLAMDRGTFHLIAVWDGKSGDGPGGSADLVAQARAETDRPDIIAPFDLERLQDIAPEISER